MIFLIGVHGQPVSFHPVRSADEKALATSYKTVCTLVSHYVICPHTHTENLKTANGGNHVWKENHIRRWLHVLEPFKCNTCVDVYELSSGIALRRRLRNLLVPLEFRGSHESHSQFGLNTNHLDELSVPYGLSLSSRHEGPMSCHRIYISKSRVWDPQLTALRLDSQPFANTRLRFKVVVD